MAAAVLRRVAFFCGVFTVQCCVTVLGNIARDSIFLRSFHASSISTLTLALSVSNAYILTAVSHLLTRLTRLGVPPGVIYALVPSALGIGLLVLATASLQAPLLARGTAVAIYMWLEIAAQLLTGQFWDLCAKAFDVAQSKKFFGFITFGTTFGTLLASLLVLPMIQERNLPTEYNLIVGGGLLFVVAGVLFVSAGHFVPTTTTKTDKDKSSNGKAHAKEEGKEKDGATAITSEIQMRTYLKHICFFDMLATVMRVLVDNRTLSILSSQSDEQLVKESLTMVNSVQSFIMIPMQLASGPFFTRFGVMYGIALLPVSVFFFGAAASTAATTTVMPLVVSRAFYNAVSLAIFNPARELLWLPFNAGERSRFKGFVAGPFRSLSRVFGAVLSIILTTKFAIDLFGASCMSVVMMVASLAWVADAMAARKSYAAEFYSSLKKGYLDLSSPLVDFTPDQLALVKETLVTGAQNQINYVLSSLSHDHVGLFSQELRDLFHKRDENNSPVTPLHTKLRLMTLHTAAKRRFILQSDESLFAPDVTSIPPPGIFNGMDLMMLIKEKTAIVPRRLRVAAILACGYEKYNFDTKDKCLEILKQVLQNSDEDKSVTVCAAVALLRLSDWMDEEANVILQRLLHEEKDLDSRVVCLKIVGRELPELLGDGYLVYLLHHSSPQIVQAAVECCSNSMRNSKMLIPALVKHLSNSAIRSQVVVALKWFDPAAMWATLEQYVESSLLLSNSGPQQPEHAHLDRREVLAGALKALEAIPFPFHDKLDMLLHLIECLIIDEAGALDVDTSSHERYTDVLFRLFGRDAFVEELVVDSLLALISSTDTKTVQAYSHEMNRLHLALETKIREAYEMRHVMRLFHAICPTTASNIEETSPLLLQHVEHSLKDTIRILLKLLSTGFPREFNVSVILEGLQSDVAQVHSAIQEVLENLLPSNYKNKVLPLLFPGTSSKSTVKIEKDIHARFGGKNGVELLLDTMRCKQRHVELTCLALQYFLHIAEDHVQFMDEHRKQVFGQDVLPHLMESELAKELLVEVYHSRRHVLPYDCLSDLEASEPPLLSKIAISNCLRVSSLFENVCAIGILRVLSHHFVPVAIPKGDTFIKEGELASAMYVIAVGSVQLHKNRRVLADVSYGTCVGQAALLRHSLHEGNHIASATAMTDCILLRVARSDLTALINETPRVSRGVLNAVASSLRWLYFEPLDTLTHSGSLPRRDHRRTSIVIGSSAATDGTENMLQRTASMTSSLKAVMSVDRAAKSFLYNVGRTRTSEPAAPLSLPGKRMRNRSFQNLSSATQASRRSDVVMARGALGFTEASDYSTFEKSIHLKGSQLVKNLDDEKVSLVAQLTKVITLDHGEVLYTDGSPSSHVYVVVEGTITISKSDTGGGPSMPAQELRHGDCFGEESFVENTTMHGQATSLGRTTIFQIPTKELIDLSELHADLMQVILAWLAEKLAHATDAMLGALLSPDASASKTELWNFSDDEDAVSVYRQSEHNVHESDIKRRPQKSRAETD